MTPLHYRRGFSTRITHGEGGNRTHAMNTEGRPLCGAAPARLFECDPMLIQSVTFEHLNGVARITPAEIARYIDCKRCLTTLNAEIVKAGGPGSLSPRTA